MHLLWDVVNELICGFFSQTQAPVMHPMSMSKENVFAIHALTPLSSLS